MTTILASMKHKLMVSDSAATGMNTVKLFRVRDKLVGVAGLLTHALKFVRWFEHGTPMNLVYDSKEHTFDAIVLDEDGLYYYDNELVPALIKEEVYAIGSGADFALGAIDAGASPKKAVQIAIERDENSGGPVVVLKL